MEAAVYCFAFTFVLFISSVAGEEEGLLFSKADDETLLTMSTIFLAVCVVFFLVTIATAIFLVKKVKEKRKNNAYFLEEREERSQNIFGGKTNGLYEEPPQQMAAYQLQDTNEDVDQSTEGLFSEIFVNGHLISTDSISAEDHKDTTENDKEQKILSSFYNPAYDTSVPSGLNDIDTKL
ncbi:uncharacterized protein [Acropora muricata]|uniref:uncharacterized protein n=1 Tax=Acropora muricata TaxID=159855 RepID=UPI0034E60C3C